MRHGLYRACAACGHFSHYHDPVIDRVADAYAPVHPCRKNACACPGWRPRRLRSLVLPFVNVRVDPIADPTVVEFWSGAHKVGEIRGLHLVRPGRKESADDRP